MVIADLGQVDDNRTVIPRQFKFKDRISMSFEHKAQPGRHALSIRISARNIDEGDRVTQTCIDLLGKGIEVPEDKREKEEEHKGYNVPVCFSYVSFSKFFQPYNDLLLHPQRMT